jgi:hypothetical protein
LLLKAKADALSPPALEVRRPIEKKAAAAAVAKAS